MSAHPSTRRSTKRSGLSPIFPVTRRGTERSVMKEGYECLRSAYGAGPCEENAHAGAAVRERSGCLVLTAHVIAIDVPKGRWARCWKSGRFVRKSVNPRCGSTQAHEWIPTSMCVWCVKTTTLWQFGPPVRRRFKRRREGGRLQPDADEQKCQPTGSNVQNRGYWAVSGESSGPDRRG